MSNYLAIYNGIIWAIGIFIAARIVNVALYLASVWLICYGLEIQMDMWHMIVLATGIFLFRAMVDVRH